MVVFRGVHHKRLRILQCRYGTGVSIHVSVETPFEHVEERVPHGILLRSTQRRMFQNMSYACRIGGDSLEGDTSAPSPFPVRSRDESSKGKEVPEDIIRVAAVHMEMASTCCFV